MKIHLHRQNRSDIAACGIPLPNRVKCDVLAIDCGRCRRTRYFNQLNKQRFPEPSPAAKPVVDPSFYWEHLNQIQVFEATVLAWHSERQVCRLTSLLACQRDQETRLSGEIEARFWTVPVSPGQRLCFSAYCSQRWDELTGRIPFLSFEQIIRVYRSQKQKKRKTAYDWIWTRHARQRQAQRMIPDDVVHFVLSHGISWQENQYQIYRMPESWGSFPNAKLWRKLQVITEGRTIITLYLNYKPLPKLI